MKGSIFLEGSEYISASRAAELTKYSKDYIGQLCRHGKVKSSLMGRSWFVQKKALLDYKNIADKGREDKRLQASENAKKVYHKDDEGYLHDKPIIPEHTLLSLVYSKDKKPLLPDLKVKEYRPIFERKPGYLAQAEELKPSVIARINLNRVLSSYKMNVADLLKNPKKMIAIALAFMVIGFTAMHSMVVTNYSDDPNISKLISLENKSLQWSLKPLIAIKEDSKDIFNPIIIESSDLIRDFVYSINDFALNLPIARENNDRTSLLASVSQIFSSKWYSITNWTKVRVISWLGLRDLASKDADTTSIAIYTTKPSEVVQDPRVVTKVYERPSTTIVNQIDAVLLARISAIENQLNYDRGHDRSQTDVIYTSIGRNISDLANGGTFTNVSITGANITSSTFSGSVGGTTGTFSTSLSTGGQLTITGTGTSTALGDFAFDSNTLYIDSINNRVGIGTSSPTDTLSVTGPIFLSDVTPTETSNRLYANASNLYWAGNLIGGATTGNWTTDGTHAWRATGNVGIGTTSPYAKLSVESNATEGTIIATDALGSFIGYLLDLKTASTTRFSINQSGDLLVMGSTTLQNLTFQNSTSTSATSTNLFATNATISNLSISNSFNPNAGTNMLVATDGSGNLVATSTPQVASINATSTTATSTFAGGFTAGNNSAFVVNRTATANSLTVAGNGNVGIGTTTPGTILSVAGVGNFASGVSTLYSSLTAPFFTATSSTASIFPYASSTALTVSGTGGLQLATGLNGPLQANNGLVSATTSIGVLYGGTGQTSLTSSQLIYGAGTGAVQSVATSSPTGTYPLQISGAGALVGPATTFSLAFG
ncbi:MAG: hypothetical protein WCW03_03730, partial [Candidatus Paceibacterota bacterium]